MYDGVHDSTCGPPITVAPRTPQRRGRALSCSDDVLFRVPPNTYFDLGRFGAALRVKSGSRWTKKAGSYEKVKGRGRSPGPDGRLTMTGAEKYAKVCREGAVLGTGSSPKFRTYRQIPTLRPYYYSVTQLILRYNNLELLNFAHIFLAYFLKLCYAEQVPVQNTEFWCDR